METWQETRSSRLLGKDVELFHTILIRVRQPISKVTVLSSTVSFTQDIERIAFVLKKIASAFVFFPFNDNPAII